MPASRHGILSAGNRAATQPGSGKAKESIVGSMLIPSGVPLE
jgi:hypothetical protein